MSEKVRAERDIEDRGAVRKTASASKAAAASAARLQADETERLGRNQQRRATAYGRARGRL